MGAITDPPPIYVAKTVRYGVGTPTASEDRFIPLTPTYVCIVELTSPYGQVVRGIHSCDEHLATVAALKLLEATA